MRMSRRMATHAQGGKIKQPLYTGSFSVTQIGAFMYMYLLTSGTLTIQSNGEYDLFVVGGGGSGKRYTGNLPGQSGGGSGRTSTILQRAIDADTPIAVTIGAGGGMHSSGSNTNAGGTTSIGSLLSATGGTALTGDSNANGANGGSGGGQGGFYDDEYSRFYRAGDGGSNGANGQAGGYGYGNVGTGQGTTTRAFAEAINTLYAGGGGGGMSNYMYSVGSRPGGAGGGGGGGTRALMAVSGTINTGGGGGGGGGDYYSSSTTPGAAGGSGIAIIRWAA